MPCQVEDSIIKAFLELVVKLNETAFEPLFRRLHDWAFGEAGGEWLHSRSAQDFILF